jgi:murein L,D-transpeptidase YcbB/YkuD
MSRFFKDDLSRRTFGLGLSATVASATLAGRSASALAGNDGDIILNHSTGTRVDTRAQQTAQALSNSPPVLSAQTVENTRRSLEQHLEIQARGGWGVVEPEYQLRLGSSGRVVRDLRRRLMASGDLSRGQACHAASTNRCLRPCGGSRCATGSFRTVYYPARDA